METIMDNNQNISIHADVSETTFVYILGADDKIILPTLYVTSITQIWATVT
jgi:hypothetical protein